MCFNMIIFRAFPSPLEEKEKKIMLHKMFQKSLGKNIQDKWVIYFILCVQSYNYNLEWRINIPYVVILICIENLYCTSHWYVIKLSQIT